ncbi:hypothetical protein NSTC731_01611 [Nostoc sp. DSM 114167]|jgi:Uma2 family endonuclease
MPAGGLRQRLQSMISTISRRYSLDEYRAIAEKAEGRSEYRDREIVPIPGGTLKHSRIGGNILIYCYLCVPRYSIRAN